VAERRVLQAEPNILIPLVSRLQQFGVVPDRDFEIQWPEAFIQSPLELSQTSAQKARAATNIVRAAKDYQKPIEGVDYPISRPGQTVSAGSSGGGGFGKPTIHSAVLAAADPKAPGKKPVAPADNKKAPVPPEDKAGSGGEPPKPLVIPNENIQVPKDTILTSDEIRKIIFAEGDLRSAGSIDGKGAKK
jgi:hypothetical protein